MPRGPQPGSVPKLTKEQKAARRGVLGRLVKYVGGRYPGGKRGKGSENKQQVLMVLSTGEDNKYPRYMKLHV